jgi:hypothetical protein
MAVRFFAFLQEGKRRVHMRALAICFALTFFSMAAAPRLAAQTPAPATN